MADTITNVTLDVVPIADHCLHVGPRPAMPLDESERELARLSASMAVIIRRTSVGTPLQMSLANGLVFRRKRLEYAFFVLSVCRTLCWVTRVEAVAAAVHDVEVLVEVLS